MENIRDYLIGIMAAAIICGGVNLLLDNKGTMGVVVKLMSGLLMILAVVGPWTSISLDNLIGWTNDISADGSSVIADADAAAKEAYREGIKQRVATYVLEKAAHLECNLEIDVTLTEDAVARPVGIILVGNVSPYAKSVLSNMIAEELGIAREEQIWTQ